MRTRQLAQRLRRVDERIPKPKEDRRVRISFVEANGEVMEQLLIENGTHRWIMPGQDVETAK